MLLSADQLAAMTDRPTHAIEYIVVHHTAEDPTSTDIAVIAKSEEAGQGFVTVGYHCVIQGDGKLQEGRPITKVPAANYGLNEQSYAIALEGNFQPGSPGYRGDKPTQAQLDALVARIKLVKSKVPSAKYLIGHRDVAAIAVKIVGGTTADYATQCPGDDLWRLLHGIRLGLG